MADAIKGFPITIIANSDKHVITNPVIHPTVIEALRPLAPAFKSLGVSITITDDKYESGLLADAVTFNKRRELSDVEKRDFAELVEKWQMNMISVPERVSVRSSIRVDPRGDRSEVGFFDLPANAVKAPLER